MWVKAGYQQLDLRNKQVCKTNQFARQTAFDTGINSGTFHRGGISYEPWMEHSQASAGLALGGDQRGPSEERDCNWGSRMASDGTMEHRLNLPGTSAIQTPSSIPGVHLTYKSSSTSSSTTRTANPRTIATPEPTVVIKLTYGRQTKVVVLKRSMTREIFRAMAHTIFALSERPLLFTMYKGEEDITRTNGTTFVGIS
jgi:hypothetical protein